MIIDRENARAYEIEPNDKLPKGALLCKAYCAFLGIITVLTKNFLVFVEKVHNVAKIEKNSIYEIESISFVPFEGFVGCFNCTLSEKKLDYFLISRRSTKCGGTRYNSRGIDDEGNAANFCESEQIIYYDDKFCAAHVQIRGSVPVFWEQRGLTTQTKINRTYELTNPAFLKHFQKMNQEYGKILCVNLMAKSKKNEQIITDVYESHIKGNLNSLTQVRYEFFDFHYQCSGQKFENVNPEIKKLQFLNESFMFFMQNYKNKNVLMNQKGVVRTNCLDCLDRTNFFQTKTAAVIFECIMRHFNVDLSNDFKYKENDMSLVSLLDTNSPDLHPFIVNFKNLWADNGDFISKHYTGTGSTHTNITRSGRRDLMGMIDHGMKSLGRFYIQNFEDHIKQEAIDILLGSPLNGTSVLTEKFNQMLSSREREFSHFSPLSVFIVSWNMNGFVPSGHYDLGLKLFNLENNPMPDFIVIALQEVIQAWDDVLKNNISRLDSKYILIFTKEHSDCLTYIFSKEIFAQRITRVSHDLLKGATLVKLWIDDTSFCFINCILDPDIKNSNSRITNIEDIHEKAFQSKGVGLKKSEKIKNLDYRFLFGNMNFQINLEESKIRDTLDSYETLIKDKNTKEANDSLNTLLENDELKISREISEILKNYHEAPIMYSPASVYEPYSTVYKSDKVPGWFDRILIWPNENYLVKQFLYKRREYLDSDHRPIVAYYNLEIKKISQRKRDQIIKKIVEVNYNINILERTS